MEKGLISVIIPVYNVEKYLRECLDSVLAQTYTDYEVIMVDDGSTDASGAICDEYAARDERFRVIHKENGGASTARNAGLNAAAGEFLYFLDSDDLLCADAFRKMLCCALDNNADLVFIEAETFNEDNTDRKGSYYYHQQYLPQSPYEVMGTPFFFIKKSVFDNNGLRFTEGIVYEDLIMAYMLFSSAQRCAHVHEVVYKRRFHPNSVVTSAKTEKNYISAATVYWEVEKFRESLPECKQSPKHLIRCAFKVLDDYRHMTPQVRAKHKEDHKKIINDIMQHNAFGDKALKLDCKSHLLWAAYKLKSKLFDR